jgi:hypothetical protein
VKHRNSRVREIAFHTLFCMVSMVSILLTMQKKIHLKKWPTSCTDNYAWISIFWINYRKNRLTYMLQDISKFYKTIFINKLLMNIATRLLSSMKSKQNNHHKPYVTWKNVCKLFYWYTQKINRRSCVQNLYVSSTTF